MSKSKTTHNAAIECAALLGVRGAKVCPLPHPCRICGKEEPKATTVHLTGKHSLSSCYDCGRRIDRLIKHGKLSLKDARNNAKCRAALSSAEGE